MASAPERTVDIEEKSPVSNVTPPPSELKYQHGGDDGDVALKILEGRDGIGEYVLDSEMRKRVLRKIDLRILPILT